MKKVVFKGTINGIDFDNVNDYNDKMSELIASGESISASSKTEIADEEERTKPDTSGVEPACGVDINEVLPYFDDYSTTHYLDRLVSGDKDLDEKTIKDLEGTLNKCYSIFEKILDTDGYDLDDLTSLIEHLKYIRTTLKEDKKTNDNTKSDLIKRMEDIDDKLKVIDSANPFIELLSNYYDKVWDGLRKYLLS